MRLILFSSISFCLMSSLGVVTTQAAEGSNFGTGNRVEIPLLALLAPSVGFEEKNNVQVVLYGSLPNSCYSLAEPKVQKISANTFRVRQFAIHETSGICSDEATLPAHSQMMIPFMQEVAIGRLAIGNYQFVYDKLSSGDQVRLLNVAQNVTPTVDSLPYAAVSSVNSPDAINGIDHIVATISGVLNSSCTSIDDNVRVMREDDVFVLLPTIKVDPTVRCVQMLIPFEKKVDLGPAKHPGIYLLHTRSMNGKAVNKVVNVMK